MLQHTFQFATAKISSLAERPDSKNLNTRLSVYEKMTSSPAKNEENVLLSHVFTAFLKCPPSICAQRDVKRRCRRSPVDKGALTFDW
jgi:hypothetical protein